ncbi:MAG TPA: DUF4160 domain-containing protein [Chitinophagaceae bacterium]|nr:DUF4160 domain-containing protein [Chitinophagaceae bacterium]
MPQLTSFYGIVIYLYFFDHNPPHFHARYGNEEVVISILDLTELYGHIPKRAFSLVIEWASQHRTELLDNWERCQQGLLPQKINPLP